MKNSRLIPSLPLASLLLIGLVIFGINARPTPARAETGREDVEIPSVGILPIGTPSCGLYSVLNLARCLGRAIDEKSVQDLCRSYPQEEMSLFDVQNAAKQTNVDTEGVRATLEELQKRGQPFIAALPDHFICVERVEDDWVRFYQNSELKIQSRSGFAGNFSGKALVLSTQATQQAVLQITPAIVDWGKVATGTSEKRAKINLSNPSNRAIDIVNITTSCSCTVPSQWPRQIGPGQTIPLEITVKVPERGEFNQSVTIFSSGLLPHQIVSLFGHVESDLYFNPSHLLFGEVTAGTTVTEVITVRDDDHKLQRPLRVTTTDRILTADIIPQTQDSWKITATLVVPSRLGEINASILISDQEQGKLVEGDRVFRVPVSGRIVSMTRARPEQVVFGSIAPEGASRLLQLFRQDRQPFEVLGIDTPSYLHCTFVADNQKNTEWSVRISIDPSISPAQVSDKIVVKTRHGEQEEDISVLILALNEGISLPLRPGSPEAALLPRAEDDRETRIGLPLPKVKIGEPAPDFRAVDARGNPWHLNALHGQKNVVLTFFPKCFTGGCASHLSSLRDLQAEFDAAKVQVLAVSTDAADGEKGQRAFAQQWQLSFPLLPDVQRTLCKLYGAVQTDGERAARMTFLIDKTGIVRWIDTDVQVQTHGADVMAQIRELKMD